MSLGFFELTRKAARIVVIEPGQMGDTVHLLPPLWELRQNYPGAEIHTVSSPLGAEILGMAGCVDKIWILEQSRKKRSLAAQIRVLTALRKLRFDVSINFGDNDRNLIHAAFIGARHRLGHRCGRWHFWSRYCIGHWVGPQDRQLPVYEQRRQVLAQAGLLLGPAPRFELRPPDAARAWAEANVPDSAIHLSINASSPFKEWPVSQWTGLLALLRERGLSVVATCAMESRERERLDKLAAEAGGANLRIFAGLDIPRLTALLSRCRLHIGADSGAIHLAMALGLPTVGIFRDYAGRAEWTPVASPHRQVSRPCRCSSVIQDDCGRAGTALCLAGIMPDQVFTNGVELLLGQVTAEDLTQRRRDSEGSRQN